MKALRYGISCLLAAGLASIAACGGSTDNDADTGSGGKGSGSAGRGSTAGTGSTPGAPSSTNDPACPATAPANATACTLSGRTASCSYTGTNCQCARTGGGGGMLPGGMAGATATATRQWQCTAALVCPTAKPTNGDACTPAPGNCRYTGMGSCSCNQQSKWACTGGNNPGGGTGGAFGGVGGSFNGAAGSLIGAGGRFGGGFAGSPGGFAGAPVTGAAGAPMTSNCPATKPAADSACTGSDVCPYTGGGCVCSSNKWTCVAN